MTRASTKTIGKQTTGVNVSSAPLDGVFFHTKESIGLWKYVVKRFIVDETELSDSA